MVEPQSRTILEELRKVTGCRISPQLIGPQTFLKLLNRHYGEPNFQSEVQDGNIRMVDPDQPIEPPVESPKSLPPLPTNGAASQASSSIADTLGRLETTQRHEVAVLRAMVELLIDRGVFTREEYLARVRK